MNVSLLTTSETPRNYSLQREVLEYRTNWEKYTPYAGAAIMLLHINGTLTMRKLKPSPMSWSFVLNRSVLSISRCGSRYEADLSVVSFISSSMGYMRPTKPPNLELFRERLRFMVSNATFNNISVISWRSVLLMEETGVPGENHIESYWQTLSHNVVSSTPLLSRIRTHNNRHCIEYTR